MTELSSWSATAAANQDAPPDGPPELMDRSEVNDCIRENMAKVRRFLDDADWFDPNIGPAGGSGPFVVTQNSTTVVRIAGVDATAYYNVNRKVRIRSVAEPTGASYAFVASRVYSAPDTLVTLEDFDAGAPETTVPADANGLDMYLLGGSAEFGIGRTAFADDVTPYFEVPTALTAAAINTAITNAAGSNNKIVLLDADTYIIETPIVLLTETTIWGRGPGRTILQASSAPLVGNVMGLADNLGNVVIRDLLIDGLSASLAAASHGIHLAGNNVNVHIQNVWIADTYSDGIALDDAGGGSDQYDLITIRDVTVQDTGAYGIRILDSDGLNDRILLSGIRVQNPGTGGALDLTADGILIDGRVTLSDIHVRMDCLTAVTGAGIRAEQASVAGAVEGFTRGTLTNFSIVGFASAATGLFIGGNKSHFSNGYVKMTGASAFPLVIDGRGAGAEAAANNQISNCTFEDGVRNRLFSDADDTVITGCRFSAQSDDNLQVNSDRLVMTGCYFEDAGVNGITLTAAAGGASIASCTIRGAAVDGIELESGASDASIRGNKIYNCTEDGVEVQSGAADTIISGNHIYGCAGDGVELQAGALRTAVDFNRFEDISGSDIDDSASTSLLGWNQPYAGRTRVDAVQQTDCGVSEVVVTGMGNIAFPFGADGTRQYRVTGFLAIELANTNTIKVRLRKGTSGTPLSNAVWKEVDITSPVANDAQEWSLGDTLVVPAAGEMLTVSIDETSGSSGTHDIRPNGQTGLTRQGSTASAPGDVPGLHRSFVQIELVNEL